jgi:hypothetical protein
MSDPLPAYDPSHPHTEIAGYDVVRVPDVYAEPLVVEVSAYVDDARNYSIALELAKAHRTESSVSYGYTTDVYACGCRWIGAIPALFSGVTFRDHERYRA